MPFLHGIFSPLLKGENEAFSPKNIPLREQIAIYDNRLLDPAQKRSCQASPLLGG